MKIKFKPLVENIFEDTFDYILSINLKLETIGDYNDYFAFGDGWNGFIQTIYDLPDPNMGWSLVEDNIYYTAEAVFPDYEEDVINILSDTQFISDFNPDWEIFTDKGLPECSVDFSFSTNHKLNSQEKELLIKNIKNKIPQLLKTYDLTFSTYGISSNFQDSLEELHPNFSDLLQTLTKNSSFDSFFKKGMGISQEEFSTLFKVENGSNPKDFFLSVYNGDFEPIKPAGKQKLLLDGVSIYS